MYKLDLLAAFMAYVDKTSSPKGCWLWTGGRYGRKRGKSGGTYGAFRKDYAHRVAWRLFKGRIPWKKCVLHKCDNPPCVNPKHLFIGTRRDNAADRDRKGRTKPGWVPGELNGRAKLKEADVLRIRSLHAQKVPNAETAREYGVSKVLIGLIVRRITWKHVA